MPADAAALPKPALKKPRHPPSSVPAPTQEELETWDTTQHTPAYYRALHTLNHMEGAESKRKADRSADMEDRNDGYFPMTLAEAGTGEDPTRAGRAHAHVFTSNLNRISETLEGKEDNGGEIKILVDDGADTPGDGPPGLFQAGTFDPAQSLHANHAQSLNGKRLSRTLVGPQHDGELGKSISGNPQLRIKLVNDGSIASAQPSPSVRGVNALGVVRRVSQTMSESRSKVGFDDNVAVLDDSMTEASFTPDGGRSPRSPRRRRGSDDDLDMMALSTRTAVEVEAPLPVLKSQELTYAERSFLYRKELAALFNAVQKVCVVNAEEANLSQLQKQEEDAHKAAHSKSMKNVKAKRAAAAQEAEAKKSITASKDVLDYLVEPALSSQLRTIQAAKGVSYISSGWVVRAKLMEAILDGRFDLNHVSLLVNALKTTRQELEMSRYMLYRSEDLLMAERRKNEAMRMREQVAVSKSRYRRLQLVQIADYIHESVTSMTSNQNAEGGAAGGQEPAGEGGAEKSSPKLPHFRKPGAESDGDGEPAAGGADLATSAEEWKEVSGFLEHIRSGNIEQVTAELTRGVMHEQILSDLAWERKVGRTEIETRRKMERYEKLAMESEDLLSVAQQTFSVGDDVELSIMTVLRALSQLRQPKAGLDDATVGLLQSLAPSVAPTVTPKRDRYVQCAMDEEGQKSVAELEEEVRELTAALEKERNSVRTLKRDNMQLKEDLRSSTAQVKELSDQVQEANRRLADMKVLEGVIKSKEEEIMGLELNIKRLEMDLRNSSDKIAELSEEAREAADALFTTKNELTAKIKECTAATTERDEQKKLILSMQANHASEIERVKEQTRVQVEEEIRIRNYKETAQKGLDPMTPRPTFDIDANTDPVEFRGEAESRSRACSAVEWPKSESRKVSMVSSRKTSMATTEPSDDDTSSSSSSSSSAATPTAKVAAKPGAKKVARKPSQKMSKKGTHKKSFSKVSVTAPEEGVAPRATTLGDVLAQQHLAAEDTMAGSRRGSSASQLDDLYAKMDNDHEKFMSMLLRQALVSEQRAEARERVQISEASDVAFRGLYKFMKTFRALEAQYMEAVARGPKKPQCTPAVQSLDDGIDLPALPKGKQDVSQLHLGVISAGIGVKKKRTKIIGAFVGRLHKKDPAADGDGASQAPYSPMGSPRHVPDADLDVVGSNPNAPLRTPRAEDDSDDDALIGGSPPISPALQIRHPKNKPNPPGAPDTTTYSLSTAQVQRPKFVLPTGKKGPKGKIATFNELVDTVRHPNPANAGVGVYTQHGGVLPQVPLPPSIPDDPSAHAHPTAAPGVPLAHHIPPGVAVTAGSPYAAYLPPGMAPAPQSPYTGSPQTGAAPWPGTGSSSPHSPVASLGPRAAATPDGTIAAPNSPGAVPSAVPAGAVVPGAVPGAVVPGAVPAGAVVPGAAPGAVVPGAVPAGAVVPGAVPVAAGGFMPGAAAATAGGSPVVVPGAAMPGSVPDAVVATVVGASMPGAASGVPVAGASGGAAAAMDGEGASMPGEGAPSPTAGTSPHAAPQAGAPHEVLAGSPGSIVAPQGGVASPHHGAVPVHAAAPGGMRGRQQQASPIDGPVQVGAGRVGRAGSRPTTPTHGRPSTPTGQLSSGTVEEFEGAGFAGAVVGSSSAAVASQSPAASVRLQQPPGGAGGGGGLSPGGLRVRGASVTPTPLPQQRQGGQASPRGQRAPAVPTQHPPQQVAPMTGPGRGGVPGYAAIPGAAVSAPGGFAAAPGAGAPGMASIHDFVVDPETGMVYPRPQPVYDPVQGQMVHPVAMQLDAHGMPVAQPYALQHGQQYSAVATAQGGFPPGPELHTQELKLDATAGSAPAGDTLGGSGGDAGKKREQGVVLPPLKNKVRPPGLGVTGMQEVVPGEGPPEEDGVAALSPNAVLQAVASGDMSLLDLENAVEKAHARVEWFLNATVEEEKHSHGTGGKSRAVLLSEQKVKQGRAQVLRLLATHPFDLEFQLATVLGVAQREAQHWAKRRQQLHAKSVSAKHVSAHGRGNFGIMSRAEGVPEGRPLLETLHRGRGGAENAPPKAFSRLDSGFDTTSFASRSYQKPKGYVSQQPDPQAPPLEPEPQPAPGPPAPAAEPGAGDPRVPTPQRAKVIDKLTKRRVSGVNPNASPGVSYGKFKKNPTRAVDLGIGPERSR